MSRASIERVSGARPRGFSLLEVLVTTALFSVVLAGVYLLYTTMQETFARGEMQSDLQQNARVGLDRMVQELRMTGYDRQRALDQVASQPFNAIRAAGASCLAFVTSRIHDDGSERSVQVTYRLSGTSLQRREDDWDPVSRLFGAPSTQPVAEAVRLLAFTYYDAFGSLLAPSGAATGGCPPGTAPSISLLDTTQARQVRRVGITLRTLETRARVASQSYTLTSHVYLRNR